MPGLSPGIFSRHTANAVIPFSYLWVSKQRHCRPHRFGKFSSSSEALDSRYVTGSFSFYLPEPASEGHSAWSMVSNASGAVSDCLRLESRARKGTFDRVVPMSSNPRSALGARRTEQLPGGKYVVKTGRSPRTSAQAIVNLFFRWYYDFASWAVLATPGEGPSSRTPPERYQQSGIDSKSADARWSLRSEDDTAIH